MIGQSIEKYLTLSWGDHLVFKDSLQFLSASLEKLVENLSERATNWFPFRHLREGMADLVGRQGDRAYTFGITPKMQLLLRKGVFPYDYLSREEKLADALPLQKEFDSRLRNSKCSDADYKHACEVYRAFDCDDLRDYMMLYLKTDVLQLADVFEQFRTVCRDKYLIDPGH